MRQPTRLPTFRDNAQKLKHPPWSYIPLNNTEDAISGYLGQGRYGFTICLKPYLQHQFPCQSTFTHIQNHPNFLKCPFKLHQTILKHHQNLGFPRFSPLLSFVQTPQPARRHSPTGPTGPTPGILLGHWALAARMGGALLERLSRRCKTLVDR